MALARFARRWLTPASLVLAAAACGSTSQSARAPSPSGAGTSSGPCPGGPVPTLVTVAQWTDIVSQLAGPCATVETVLASSSIDPHDYEPTPGDLARFEKAELVVRNGLDYDAWATKAVAALAHEPTVVDAGSVVGLKSGDNPHVWYGPSYVGQVADAVTAALRELRPAAAELLQRQRSTFAITIAPYLAEIDAIKQAKQGMTYGATEAVFDDMASAAWPDEPHTGRLPAGGRQRGRASTRRPRCLRDSARVRPHRRPHLQHPDRGRGPSTAPSSRTIGSRSRRGRHRDPARPHRLHRLAAVTAPPTGRRARRPLIDCSRRPQAGATSRLGDHAAS